MRRHSPSAVPIRGPRRHSPSPHFHLYEESLEGQRTPVRIGCAALVRRRLGKQCELAEEVAAREHAQDLAARVQDLDLVNGASIWFLIRCVVWYIKREATLPQERKNMRSPISPATMTVSPSRGRCGHSLAHPILMCAEHPYGGKQSSV